MNDGLNYREKIIEDKKIKAISLRNRGWSIRRIMVELGYKSPNSITKLLQINKL